MKFSQAIIVFLALVQGVFAQQQPTTTPTANQPRTNSPQDVRPQGPQGVQPPSFLPLSEKHQEYIQRVLLYWQNHTEKVDHYRSDFERWQFDTVNGPRNTFKPFSTEQRSTTRTYTQCGERLWSRLSC